MKRPEWADSLDTSLAAKWGVAVLRVDPAAQPDAAGWFAGSGIENLNFLVLADPATATLTPEELLWHAAGNTDPGRDMRICGGTMIVDARTKSPRRDGYPQRTPNVVVSGPDTIALVDSRREEYGLGELPPSPSRKYAGLVYSDKAEV